MPYQLQQEPRIKQTWKWAMEETRTQIRNACGNGVPGSSGSLDRYERPEGREKGVLLPVFSLPSEYGIGCFSKEAYRFIDWLKQTGHTCWQILPLNITGCGDSPYQPLSSFAGNVYFIDPQQLLEQNLITAEELESFDFGNDPRYVDYEVLYDDRIEMLHLAYRRFSAGAEDGREYREFLAENDWWLSDYALFMALRGEFGRENTWDDWPEPLRRRDPQALREAEGRLSDEIGYHRWTQFEFYRQWAALKRYAGESGIRIIGDMPIYVSYDSADCWADPGQFQLDENLQPVLVAGVPPDAFTEEGQLWGNPLYDWDKMKQDGYRWWLNRIHQSFRLYDVIRLDHFRGYEAYYTVPAGAENAIHGTWKPGPGIGIFRLLEQDLGGSAPLNELFIAEDLGFLTDGVKRLLKESGFSGIRVLQFGFDGDPENMYLAENIPENCVVYTGTHDNDTTAGWFDELSPQARSGILQYLGWSAEDAARAVASMNGEPERHAVMAQAADRMVLKALNSRAGLAVIPMQDYLRLGSEARINIPGTVGDNWDWRMRPEEFPGLLF